MLTIVTLGLALVLSIAFTGAGYAKVTDQPIMVKARSHLGLSAEVYRAVGMVELLGALGVLLGVFGLFNWLGLVSALGLMALMLGALLMHLKAQDTGREFLPALSMIGLTTLYLTTVVVG